MDDKKGRRPDIRLLGTLLITFMKIGAFTFGGGYAMIALLENEFVTVRKWLTKDEFLDMVALAESTPGPIAINSATYIGYRAAGILGSVISTIAVSLPSLIIIYIISLFLNDFLALRWVRCAFGGIQVCVVYLIFSAGLKMYKGIKKTPVSVGVMAVVFVLFVVFSLTAVSFSSIWFILICGVLSLCAYELRIIRERRAKR